MTRDALLRAFAVTALLLLAGCASPDEDARPRTAVPDDDGGDLPRVPLTNGTVPPVPPESGGKYTPPNRTAPPDDMPPELAIHLEAVPEFSWLRMNYTLVGTDAENATLIWKADLDGDGVFEASGLGLPQNQTRVFRIHGPYRATLVAHDGFHEREVSVTYSVAPALIAPYMDVAGTVAQAAATPAQMDSAVAACQADLAPFGTIAPPSTAFDEVDTYEVPGEAWNAPWQLSYNYTPAFHGVMVVFYDDAGEVLGCPSTVDEPGTWWLQPTFDELSPPRQPEPPENVGFMNGTIPRQTATMEVFASAASLDYHFWAFSQGWCRPARANCQDNAGDPYTGGP